jgi:hypothetical protein
LIQARRGDYLCTAEARQLLPGEVVLALTEDQQALQVGVQRCTGVALCCGGAADRDAVPGVLFDDGAMERLWLPVLWRVASWKRLWLRVSAVLHGLRWRGLRRKDSAAERAQPEAV